MFGQQFARAVNRGQRATAVVAGTEGRLHAPAQRIPFGLRHAGGNAAVGEDFDAAVDQLHVNQHAGVFLGIPDAEPGKQFGRALAGAAVAPQERKRQGAFDDKTDFTALTAFGNFDRRPDLVDQFGVKTP